MVIKKAFKVRLKPTEEIELRFNQFAGCCRFVWNKLLSLNRDRLNNKHWIMCYLEMAFWLTLWKMSVEYGFLKDCHSQVLQQKVKDLDKAFADGFDKKQPLKRMPKYRKKGEADSFRYPQGFKIDNRRIFLPKIGWVGFLKSQEIVGTQKNVTISRRGRHWYASIQVELEIKDPKPREGSAIGIDLGIVVFAALSTGEYIEPVNSFRKLEFKLALEQRKLARKVKFSKNWYKQKERVDEIYSKIVNVRNDFLHKTSTRLSKNHAPIVVEDLKIVNMSKSARGTQDDPGVHVGAKSGLNKSILDQGWGIFRQQLKYKQDWSNGRLLKVKPQFTSQKCSSCGYIDKENRKAQNEFCCIKCNYKENADINAARNIVAAGHAVLACEANLKRGRQQEPPRTGDQVSA